jgi:hypothetical protein
MKIKLGKLPNACSVKIAISVPEELKSQLDRYAQLHSQTWEQKVDAAALVPHIVAQFLANDPAFRKLERLAASKSSGPKLDRVHGMDRRICAEVPTDGCLATVWHEKQD